MIIGLDGNEANVKNRVGSGIYALELLRQFANIKNHEFTVYLKENPLLDLPRESANFKYLVFGPKKLWTQIALPIKLFFSSNLDIFFSLGHYGPRFSRVKYIVTIFDLSYLHFPKLFRKDDLYQLNKWSEYSIKKSIHIFTISNSTKNDIVKYYGINPAKVSVNYLGFDSKTFKPQAKSKIVKIKKKYKINGDYIIFVGTLQPRKNIERLIEAFASIVAAKSQTVNQLRPRSEASRKPSTQNLSLVIVGRKGWLYNSIFEKVKKLNLQNTVIFTGFVPNADLPSLLSGSKTYVLPSLWEGFGIPVIEAQACGVPTVVSNTSSLPEIVSPSNVILSEAKNLTSHRSVIVGSAILVNPESAESIADGIKKVLTNKELSDDLVDKGFENIKRFSWQNCAAETLKTLEKLASN